MPRIESAVMLFPHPLSPANPKISDSAISKLRCDTTFTGCDDDLKKILRSLTLSRDTAG